ncbi:MAG: hypothetical protein AAF525_00345 [Pseudomonadota bacterium]
MTLIIPDSLAGTVNSVNHADWFHQKITKRDAREAETFLRSRYFQNIPQKIREAKNPNPRWALVPKLFNLFDDEARAKPKSITGEPLANASMRMIHSRETARALYVLGEITGNDTSEADELSTTVRLSGGGIMAKKLPFF